MKRAVIIGGGISGLSAAYYLQREVSRSGEDIEVTLIEKEKRFGGCIFTEKVDGFVIEGGPDCFLSEKPWTLQLCEDLGLDDRLLCTNEENRRVFIVSRGRLHELPEGFMLMIPTSFMPFLKSSLISLPGKFRMAMDLFLPRRQSDEEESLAQFVRRRLGDEALEKIAEPLVAGIHAGTPETMSIKSTFPRFIQLEEKYRSLILGMLARKKMAREFAQRRSGPKRTMFMSLAEGMMELTDALKAKLDERSLLSNRKVSRINLIRDTYPSHNSIYEVHMEGDETLRADCVILATPVYVTAELLRDLDGTLSEVLLSIPCVSTATISLAYRGDEIHHPLDGFGFVIPRAEKRKIMASTWTSVKFSHRSPPDSVLLRAFVGGAQNEDLVGIEDEVIIDMVRKELLDIMGITAHPILTQIYRWDKSMPQYTLGHAQRLSHLEKELLRYPGLYLTGCGYRGIGISDCIHDGKLTAERVLKFLEGVETKYKRGGGTNHR
ncbi:MAG: protoporphyrinogen oxidase [Deltaproteobacteria bacterium]|nr:protoporphyrinogen oxidase [Deltaproteobacteria bacterium]